MSLKVISDSKVPSEPNREVHMTYSYIDLQAAQLAVWEYAKVNIEYFNQRLVSIIYETTDVRIIIKLVYRER